MSTDVVIFDFESSLVRIVAQDGAPWFVLPEVCRFLGISNSSDAGRRLDDDEKGVATVDTLGGPQEVVIVSESGFYSLVMRSRKPEAKRFKKWVTAEVLPAIRRSGTYGVKASAFDRIATARDSVCITDGAKLLQVGPKELFQRLHKLGWIYRRPNGAAWLGYQSAVKDGLIEHKIYEMDGLDGNPRVRTQARLTPKALTILAQQIHVESVRITQCLGGEGGRAAA
jgi:anti-repressor protein